MVDRSTHSGDILNALFNDLAELPEDLRQARIARLRLPQALEQRLRSMLAFDAMQDADSASSVLQETMASTDATDALRREVAGEAADLLRLGNDDLPGESLIGRSINNFLLCEVIGKGGSSIVFRAEREAGSGTQTVAVKLLLNGLYTRDAQLRFRREQSILAKLTHPNIAYLIEGGVSDIGIPYIAMELVEGLPITMAAEAQKLGLEQRLRWFLTLCRTVEAAHNALVVHRDLKPSNLFVASDGQLKILDFGIAKLVKDDDETQTRSLALTPEYAAPEQFSDTPLTTAVDVYALGVVLGELLTGMRLASGVRASVALAKSPEHQPIPAGLPPRNALIRHLHGELEDIVAAALAENPAHRYSNAGELANDIERRLAGRPIRAHAPSRWYATRKFLARHRISIAVLSLLFAATLASLCVAVWQAVQARSSALHAAQEAARANAEAARAIGEERQATAVANFVIELFKVSDPGVNRGERLTANQILDRGAQRIAHDFAAHPDVRGRMESVIGQVYSAMGDFTRARPYLERAIETHKSALPVNDLDLGHELRILAWIVFNLDESHDELTLQLADEAQAHLDASTSVLRSGEMLRLRTLRAGALYDSGNVDAARQEFDKASRLAATLTQPEDSVGAILLHNNYGRVLQDLGDLQGAAVELEQSSSIAGKELGENHPTTLMTNANLGGVLVELDDVDRGRTLLEKSVLRYGELFGTGDVIFATMQQSLGALETKSGHFDAAVAAFARAEAIYRASGGPQSLSAAYVTTLKADAMLARGDARAACEIYDEILNLYSKVAPDRSRELIAALNGRSRAKLALRDHRAALADAEQAVAKSRAKLPDRDYQSERSLVALAAALHASGKDQEARQALAQASVNAAHAYAHDPQAMQELQRTAGAVERR